jgi:hypothetical protein
MSLEETRAVLLECGDWETAHLVSVPILQLRMKLNRIADSELKALCDVMTPDDEPVKPLQDPKLQDPKLQDPKLEPAQRRRRPVLLKLVK